MNHFIRAILRVAGSLPTIFGIWLMGKIIERILLDSVSKLLEAVVKNEKDAS